MPKVRLLTLEALPAHGGIARYVDAIWKTFPDSVEVILLKPAQSYASIIMSILSDRREVWVQHILPLGTSAWLSRLLAGPEYVVFLHGMDFDLARRNGWKRWLTRRILRTAKRVVTNSSALAVEVSTFADVAPIVVYPCVSDKFVALAELKHERVVTDRLALLTVSRLVERKGHLKVIEAIKDLPNVSYDVVGDGPLRETILQRVEELGIGDRVKVHTNVADDALPGFYQRADVFVMPASKSETDREGFGIVYLEANLFGLPVIACRAPGVDEAIIDGETGLLIDDSVDKLKRSILHLWADRPLSEVLGKSGRERVLANFMREKQFAKLRQLL